jgi:hypothetical protein
VDRPVSSRSLLNSRRRPREAALGPAQSLQPVELGPPDAPDRTGSCLEENPGGADIEPAMFDPAEIEAAADLRRCRPFPRTCLISA